MKHWERPEYRIWSCIKTRCYNKNNDSYPNYGGRGILVCDRWLTSFANFFEDMDVRPSPAHSIERKDPNGHYEKNNCYWATVYEQVRNRRNSVFIEYGGIRKVQADWESDLGLNLGVLSKRLKRGWTMEEIVKGTRKPKTPAEAAKVRFAKSSS